MGETAESLTALLAANIVFSYFKHTFAGAFGFSHFTS